jgi:hypothetical protein
MDGRSFFKRTSAAMRFDGTVASAYVSLSFSAFYKRLVPPISVQ